MSASSPAASVAPARQDGDSGTARPAARAWRGAARVDLALVGLLALAALLRFGELGHQSFWYDEAYTPVHVLRPSLGATLHGVVHTENSPPAWYVLAWVWARVFDTGEVALRSISALAGVGLVAVSWAIGRELGSRRTAIAAAAFTAVNPLFVWYSQEARVYELYALVAALSLLLFLRAARSPTRAALAGWAAASALALATHYFAVFLVAPEALLLLVPLGPLRRLQSVLPSDTRSADADAGAAARLVAVAAVTIVGLALLPLIAAQGGHGTQWIGRWALSSRLVAIPGYYLLGGQSSAFGHGLLLLCALPALVSVGLLPGLDREEWRRVALMLSLGALGILLPLVLVAFGADYLAPRNLIAAWIPLTVALALVLTSRRAALAGTVLAALVCLAGLGIVLLTAVRPRYQRGDWRGVARVLRTGARARAIVTVELGSAPLEYYLPGLRPLATTRAASVSEIDLVGYAPLRAGASRPPAPGFRLAGRASVHGLVVYRFVSSAGPRALPERLLRARTITATRSETLVPAGVQVPRGVAIAA